MDLTYMRTSQLASEFGILVMRSGSRFGDVVVAALIDHYDKVGHSRVLNVILDGFCSKINDQMKI